MVAVPNQCCQSMAIRASGRLAAGIATKLSCVAAGNSARTVLALDRREQQVYATERVFVQVPVVD